MTALVLGAILCVLIIIARELRLLRKQRAASPSCTDQPPEEYTQRASSRLLDRVQALRFADMDTSWIALPAAVAIWFKYVMPQLPPQPWVRYPITIVGLFVLAFVADVGVFMLLDPVLTFMDKYKEKGH